MAKHYNNIETILYLDYDVFDGEIDEVIARLVTFRDLHKPKYYTINIEVDTYYDDRSIEVTVIGTRLENNEERDKRLAKNKKKREASKKAALTRAKTQESEDRKTLKRLKEKYEGP